MSYPHAEDIEKMFKKDPKMFKSNLMVFKKVVKKKEVAKKMGKKDEWHPIGAGRVGDKYKGGTIKKIDARNAKAKISYN